MTAVIDSYTYELLATPQFARIVDSTGADEGLATTTDSDGNVYIAGSCIGTPNIKDQSGTSRGTFPPTSTTTAFFSKFDSSGVYQYSGIMPANAMFKSISCDSSGNLYVLGEYASFNANILAVSNLNVSSNVARLPSSGSSGSAAVVCKFNSSGTYQYSITVSNPSSAQDGSSVTCDSAGNVYFGGSCRASSGTIAIKFINSSNVETTVGTLPIASGYNSGYVCKFNSSGTYRYSHMIYHSTASSICYSVYCDQSDNMYMGGSYTAYATTYVRFINSSNVSTYPGTLPNLSPTVSSAIAYVCKFNSSGAYQYTRIIDMPVTSGSATCYSVSCDSTGSMYMAVDIYSPSSTVNPLIRYVNSSNVTTTIATLPVPISVTSIVVSKFNSTGTYQYSRIIDSSPSNETITGVTCDPSDTMYVSGSYIGTTANILYVNSSNVSSIISTLPTVSNGAAFVSKFDSTGTYQYSRLVDSNGSDSGNGVACDSTGNMYLAGKYNGTPTIKAVNRSNVSTNIDTLPASAGGTTAFLVKFDPDGNYAP